MRNKRILITGKDALKASVSERVGVSLREINKDKLGAYAVLVPSDSAECIFFAKAAAKYAERLGVKFMIHMDRTVADTSSVFGGVSLPQLPGAQSMSELAKNCPFNDIKRSDTTVGVIACGHGYNLAREVYGDRASYLKIGMVNPISDELLSLFCASCEIIVVLDKTGLIEDKLDNLGIKYTGSREFGSVYDAESLRLTLLLEEPDFTEIADDIPIRTPNGNGGQYGNG